MLRSEILTVAVAAVALASASNAYGAGEVVATLARSDIARTRLVAGGAVFQCEENRCVARAPNYRTLTLEACKVIAHRFGRVETFGDGVKALPADKLQACQAVAK